MQAQQTLRRDPGFVELPPIDAAEQNLSKDEVFGYVERQLRIWEAGKDDPTAAADMVQCFEHRSNLSRGVDDGIEALILVEALRQQVSASGLVSAHSQSKPPAERRQVVATICAAP